MEIAIFRVAELENLGLIAELVLLDERIDPVWLVLIDLLVPDDRLRSNGVFIEAIGHEHFLSMVEYEVQRAQILDLLL